VSIQFKCGKQATEATKLSNNDKSLHGSTESQERNGWKDEYSEDSRKLAGWCRHDVA